MSNVVHVATRTNVRAVVCVAAVALIALSIRAQTAPAERSFHASRAVVERKLRQVGGYPGGKLPVLDGFVAPQSDSLDRYGQGYYHYSVQFEAAAPGETRVRVTAKITAWYAAADQAHSAYRALPSNGRLETDLLERLERELAPASAAAGASSSDRSNATARTFSLPENPSPGTTRGSSGGATLPSRAWHVPSRPPSHADIADEQRAQQLREQLKSLQEILDSQAHPDDLAAVKSSNTPILASPVEGAQVVLRAERGDEFQILELKGPWVHVRISGLSRGWIQRSQLELPTTAAAGSQSSDSSQLMESSFHKTREETSTFPGKWDPLQGKTVKIIWVQPVGTAGQSSKIAYAKSLFHDTYAGFSQHAPDVSGVVIIFDSQDGGMAAATLETIQQWAAGHLTDSTFWKRCWFDPADAFTAKE